MARIARALLALAPLALISTTALAQTDEPEAAFALPRLGQPVAAAPEALVTFYFEPSAGVEYNDNVFRAVDGAEQDDFLFVLAPAARLALTGDDMRGEIALGAEIGRHADLSQNDYEDFDIRGRAVWSREAHTTLRMDGRFRYDHSAINETEGEIARRADEVTRFFEAEGGLEGERRFDGWFLGVEGGLGLVFFEDITSTTAGPSIFNGDRDRAEAEAGFSAGIEVGGGFVAFGEALARHIGYFQEIEGRDFARTSDGGDLLVGARYGERDDALFAELALGVHYRDYAAGALDDIVFPGLRAEARYRTLDERLRLRGRAATGIRDSDLANASGYRSARLGLDASYEALPPLTLFAGFDVEWRDFATGFGAADRTDVLATAEAGARYMVYEPGYVELKVRYQDRSSDEPDARFDALRASFSVGAAF